VIAANITRPISIVYKAQKTGGPHSPVTSMQLKTSVHPKEEERKERARRHNTGVQDLLMSRW